MENAVTKYATPALLALNAGLLVLVLIQLKAVEAAAPNSPVRCGDRRDAPCYVTVVDAPQPSYGSGRWGLEGVDDRNEEAVRQRLEERFGVGGDGD